MTITRTSGGSSLAEIDLPDDFCRNAADDRQRRNILRYHRSRRDHRAAPDRHVLVAGATFNLHTRLADGSRLMRPKE